MFRNDRRNQLHKKWKRLLPKIALAIVSAFTLFIPPVAHAQDCQWYAGNDTATLYARADAACRGYIAKNGWNPPGYVYHSTRYWNSAYPTSGAQCLLQYYLYPNSTPTNLYNAGVQAEPCADPGLCPVFPSNKTFGCGKTVADLETVIKTADDPTRIFHQTQTCIAKKSCDLRCQMNNCKWMERVIPDFVTPYLQKKSNWLPVEQSCQESLLPVGWARDRACAERMARLHISQDLLPALQKSGCGSDTDWLLVYSVIADCTSQSFSSGLEQWFSRVVVGLYRERIRGNCLESRQQNGFPSAVNQNLEGKSCDQQ